MTDELDRLIQACVAETGENGVVMGALVDSLVDQGFEESPVEEAIWRMMQSRTLTPHGYLRRQVRVGAGANKAGELRRSYEFVLRVWSPELDLVAADDGSGL